MDVITGITDLDLAVAQLLRQSQKPTLLVVNKVDNHLRVADAYGFYKLGLGDPYQVSAIYG